MATYAPNPNKTFNFIEEDFPNHENFQGNLMFIGFQNLNKSANIAVKFIAALMPLFPFLILIKKGPVHLNRV